ncbi:MAG: N-acetylcysteine deacetylase [Chlamydiia bacterium]|nr:N-acetylcysteine deacetylase [Chlamydiia bacterium]MCH9615765.1 N-acetylcysteine deacetylase [Chlamydiia bacterium]MCH9628832.1 N-acetylcysteine deacetylase [Chlamydiia bacterium]
MDEIEEYVISLRRRLHEIAELSWAEVQTLALISREIEEIQDSLPWDTTFKRLEGGLYVDVEISPELPWRLFRADVDALPIQEETYLPYSSKHEGVMHACGHDAHSAMLLGALKSLPEITPMTNLRFVWQRAEEVFDSGARKLVQEGILNGMDEVFALHLDAKEEVGVFSSRPGLLLCHPSIIEIEVEAAGGHVMNSRVGTNAISLLMDLHFHLTDLVLSSYGEDLVVFAPAMIEAGQGHNIKPNSGIISYALRSLLQTKATESLVEDIEQEAYRRCSIKDFTVSSGHPALVNDGEVYQQTKASLELLGPVKEVEPLFAGEDFSYFLQKKPGVFWALGAKYGEGTDHHASDFRIDESVLIKGVKYWHTLATLAARKQVETLF